jgi:hypothetical protein
MGKQKKKHASNVICVRVSDNEMECIRELMKITQKNASSVLREAVKSVITQAA